MRSEAADVSEANVSSSNIALGVAIGSTGIPFLQSTDVSAAAKTYHA
jgi:hypothetical protein